jgi:hypothetical protein
VGHFRGSGRASGGSSTRWVGELAGKGLPVFHGRAALSTGGYDGAAPGVPLAKSPYPSPPIHSTLPCPCLPFLNI